MYSQQRRRERYMVIYMWKVLEGLVPNFGNIAHHNHQRHGRLCVLPRVKPSAPARIKTIRYPSLVEIYCFSLGEYIFRISLENFKCISSTKLNIFKEMHQPLWNAVNLKLLHYTGVLSGVRLMEKDVEGAKLDTENLWKYDSSHLMRWLRCRGDKEKGIWTVVRQ